QRVYREAVRPSSLSDSFNGEAFDFLMPANGELCASIFRSVARHTRKDHGPLAGRRLKPSRFSTGLRDRDRELKPTIKRICLNGSKSRLVSSKHFGLWQVDDLYPFNDLSILHLAQRAQLLVGQVPSRTRTPAEPLPLSVDDAIGVNHE